MNCEICKNKRYLIVINIDSGLNEIQRCDNCNPSWRYVTEESISDDDALLLFITDHKEEFSEFLDTIAS